MNDRPTRTDEDIENTVSTYADTLYRVCLSMLRNPMDAEDMVQETLIKYALSDISFSCAQQKKAWLIKVAVNLCKNQISFFHRHKQVSIEELSETALLPSEPPPDGTILDALLKVPPKYRIVMMLYYVEEYKVREIAQILHLHESSVKRRLMTGRKMLQTIYRKEFSP